MALADTAALAVKLTLDDRAFSGPLRRVQTNLGRLDKGFGRVGRGVGQLGTGLARAGLLLGGAAVAGIVAATGAALKFEDAFAGVRKTVNETDLTEAGLSFAILRDRFLEMSTEVPIAAAEFARLGEIAGALGIRAQDIDDFAKTAALLGVTTNLSADEAADALGRLGTILGLTGDDFEHIADVLVNLGNQGASTEAEIVEIAKRFAGVGRQAGLTAEQIFALASAAASLGNEPEAAGSALSRIFANMATEIANGTKKGQAFAKITGDSMDDLRKRINKGDALGIILETLEGIKGLSRTQAASTLKALGITNVRDRKVIIDMAQNLGFVKDQLDIAGESVGALATEAGKRFDVPFQKILLLRNAALRMAIAFGDGIAPAVGRAADKLATFFKDQGNLDQASALGKEIGAAIDKIDWAAVIQGAKDFAGVLQSALDIALVVLRTLAALPKEVQAAAAGFLALNKLSGGLIGAGVGNIVGGLAGAAARGAASRLPVIGAAFAQPVFVTNWPAGGLGGVAGAAGGGKKGGFLGTITSIGSVAFAGLALEQIVGPLLEDAFGEPVRQFWRNLFPSNEPRPVFTDENGKPQPARIFHPTDTRKPQDATTTAVDKTRAAIDAAKGAQLLSQTGIKGAVLSATTTQTAVLASTIRNSTPTTITTVNVYGMSARVETGTVITRSGGGSRTGGFRETGGLGGGA